MTGNVEESFIYLKNIDRLYISILNNKFSENLNHQNIDLQNTSLRLDDQGCKK